MSIVMKSTIAIACAVALSATLLAPASAISRQPDSPPVTITDSTIQSELLALGVSDTQRESLLLKLKSGVPWDSMSGASPVSVEEFEAGGFNVTRERFADGSTSEFGLEIGVQASPAQLAKMVSEAPSNTAKSTGAVTSAPQASTFGTGIQYCTTGTSAGVFYASNCQVYYHGITWSSAFRANYQRWSSGAAAQYVKASAYTIAYTLCVTSESVSTLLNKTRIRYAVNLAPACMGNIPFWLELRVSPTYAYATYGP